MAFLDTTIITPNTAEAFQDGIFNITQSVGNKEVGTGIPAINQQTDMMLVYYFLFIIFRDGDKSLFPLQQGDNLNSPEKFPVNKDYSSSATKKKLGGLILRFQENMKRTGRNVFVDGRTDRAKGAFTSITHSVFTILLLNFHYSETIKKQKGRSDWQSFLMTDSFAPAPLRMELAVNDFEFD